MWHQQLVRQIGFALCAPHMPYEGWPILYRKERMKLRYAGKTVEAMIYVMNEGRPLGQPGLYYYSVILEGYKAAGFDAEILKQAVADSDEMEEKYE